MGVYICFMFVESVNSFRNTSTNNYFGYARNSDNDCSCLVDTFLNRCLIIVTINLA